MTPITDPFQTKLINELCQGDPIAERRIFDAVYGFFRQMAQKELRNKPVSNDLNATELGGEALAILLNKELVFENRHKFRGLGKKIVHDVVVDEVRRLAGRNEVEEDEAAGLSTDDVETAVAVRQVIQKLARIDKKDAQVLWLKKAEGLTTSQVAARLELSHDEVERRYTAARAFFMREMTMSNARSDQEGHHGA